MSKGLINSRWRVKDFNSVFGAIAWSTGQDPTFRYSQAFSFRSQSIENIESYNFIIDNLLSIYSLKKPPRYTKKKINFLLCFWMLSCFGWNQNLCCYILMNEILNIFALFCCCLEFQKKSWILKIENIGNEEKMWRIKASAWKKKINPNNLMRSGRRGETKRQQWILYGWRSEWREKNQKQKECNWERENKTPAADGEVYTEDRDRRFDLSVKNKKK